MIGREKEIKELERLYDRKRAELVAVYGRRRVGKTYLIDQTFEGRFTFRHAGLSPAEIENNSLQIQLNSFYQTLYRYGLKDREKPKDWFEAFYLLEDYLESKNDGSRQLVFLDELPWLDTPRSGFMTAFESFWNNWGCHQNNLMVIVCGSANSWILDKLINNHGGLYGRVTYEIKLLPFTLYECEQYFKENNVRFSRYDIVQSYMAVGGIPYYLNYFLPEMSLAQNIDAIFFAKNAKLIGEYDRLFSSAFQNPETMKSIVEFLYRRNSGYTRKEIMDEMKISDGGGFSKNMNALIASDFVIKYVPFGFSKRQEHYKLIDPFCLFYLHFVKNSETNEHFYQQGLSSQSVISWRGFSFENVCFNHIRQIKDALGISGVITSQSAWSKRGDDSKGTQIDLLIERKDNVINMCELKYYGDTFTVDKDYYRLLLHRAELLKKEVSPKVSIYNTLITTFGLDRNEYSGIFVNVITLDDLFRK
ncbi:MAG: AAA family ATPase [Erysipelotrichaceae bacterium]|nr:AAA family ATPase [Erysipelotrichaceae bacterium]